MSNCVSPVIKNRLRDAFGDKAVYKVIGEPVSLPDARTLAEQDKDQFQWWALGLVGAAPAVKKKGPDKGIDGRLYFHDEGEGGPWPGRLRRMHSAARALWLSLFSGQLPSPLLPSWPLWLSYSQGGLQ